jgi:ATP-dependent Clp protease ATP-binding subunit ClpC
MVTVNESTVEETIRILHGLRPRYEAHHHLQISDEALRAAAEMAERYITDRFMPDKAIDLMDEASARVRLQRSGQPFSLKEAQQNIEQVQLAKEAAIKAQQYEAAADLRDREKQLRDKINNLQSSWQDRDQSSSGERNLVVTEEDIAEVVSMWTGIPVRRIAQEESERLLQMETALHGRVIGQDEAISTIAKAVRRARTGLKDPKRPIGSFIFLGPTGVGKTELAKALAEFMFGSEDMLIKIDMSEFMERHAVARLVGAPPGYVGYEEGGQLTEAVRRKSYSVVLLDEVEKAHPEVFNILLQILEDGKLTDAKGRAVDFRNTIIIMTSNVGANLLNREAALGFRTSQADLDTKAKQDRNHEEMIRKITTELRSTFKPEFLNRIDATIVFHALRQDQIREIVELMLKRVRAQLIEQEMTLDATEEAKNFLVEKGYDALNGARPLRRAIQNYIEDPLAEGLLQGKFHPGDNVLVQIVDGQLDMAAARSDRDRAEGEAVLAESES